MYKLHKRVEAAHDDAVWSACWTAKGKIVTGSVDNTVKVWDAENMVAEHELTGHDLGVIDVAVNGAGDLAASTSFDSTIKIWNLENGTCTSTIATSAAESWAIAFSPSARHLATTTHAGNVALYSVDSGSLETTFESSAKKFGLSVAYTEDGETLAMSAMDGSITVFDVATGAIKASFTAHAKPVRSLSFSPSGFLMAASDDMHVSALSVDNNEVIYSIVAHSSWVLDVTATADGAHFATSSSDKEVKIWDVMGNPAPVHVFHGHTDQVWSVAYDVTGSKLVSAGDDAAIQVYDCPT
ncbi:WD repeat-containing protein 61 [Thecamonas trahens ATCC 50062]|uniref:WD repeat-containing protein 61 n=1 Tax=Thecamonas trahens ATCC 50062 TaxID=461836 RepID=A0A0L0DFU7_THETB|nr:WD repeat-containing protein 61 [Thecamonas trahens ATCC 50062]KNC51179.1 WD repeat-containing protein 61 [Thecamonas trahens ATCC 50062]|eukprot:XP_013756381.1 WD repeat-containing protein 61 [Thecamonas trahens ATCC 50062]